MPHVFYEMPTALQNIFSWIKNLIMLDLLQGLPTPCITNGYNYFDKLLFSTIAPLGVTCMLAISFSIRSYRAPSEGKAAYVHKLYSRHFTWCGRAALLLATSIPSLMLEPLSMQVLALDLFRLSFHDHHAVSDVQVCWQQQFARP